MKSLPDTIRFLEGRLELEAQEKENNGTDSPGSMDRNEFGSDGKPSSETSIDFSDVKGQDELIEAIVPGAAGGHNILMLGEPGCGKTMIAQRIPTILPTMSEKESLEVTKIHSISGLLDAGEGLMKISCMEELGRTRILRLVCVDVV